jgi:hypothetical protein
MRELTYASQCTVDRQEAPDLVLSGERPAIVVPEASPSVSI